MQSLVAGRRAAVLLCACAVSTAQAKPIAFADGTTAMAEYGAGTMVEAQAFYAPSYRFSAGGGYLRLDSDLARRSREIEYVRANVLAKRWNLDAAQANVFVWGSLGRGRGDGFDGSRLARNAGFQLDYETRRVYAAAKSDLWESPAFSHRIDTVQFGLAPYEHDYRDLATWFVVQARRYTGEIHRGTETALLLRLFKGGTWVEFGGTTDGQVQAMAMFNF